MRGSRRGWKTALRVVISAVLLLVLLRRVDVGAVVSNLLAASDASALLTLALVLPGIGSFLGVLRWRVLLGALGARARLRTLMGAVLVGAFFNQFLPSTIGGDVIRSWWAETELRSQVVSLTVIAVDRLIGFVGFCLVAGIAAMLHPGVVEHVPAFWTSLGVVAVAGIAVYVLLGIRPGREGARSPGLRSLPLLGQRLLRAYEAVRIFREQHLALGGAVAISVVMQAVMIAQYFILSGALGIDISLMALAVLVPIVTLISLLPLTINGIGLREGALATLGATVGLSAQDAVALAWLFLIFQFIWGLFGGVLYLLGRPAATVNPSGLRYRSRTADVS